MLSWDICPYKYSPTSPNGQMSIDLNNLKMQWKLSHPQRLTLPFCVKPKRMNIHCRIFGEQIWEFWSKMMFRTDHIEQVFHAGSKSSGTKIQASSSAWLLSSASTGTETYTPRLNYSSLNIVLGGTPQTQHIHFCIQLHPIDEGQSDWHRSIWKRNSWLGEVK